MQSYIEDSGKTKLAIQPPGFCTAGLHCFLICTGSELIGLSPVFFALGPPPAPAQQQAGQRPQTAAQSEDAKAGTEKGELLRGLKAGNFDIQQKQQEQLDSLYQNSIDQGIPSSFGGGLFK